MKKFVADMPEIFQKSSEDNSLTGLNSAVLNTIVIVGALGSGLCGIGTSVIVRPSS